VVHVFNILFPTKMNKKVAAQAKYRVSLAVTTLNHSRSPKVNHSSEFRRSIMLTNLPVLSQSLWVCT